MSDTKPRRSHPTPKKRSATERADAGHGIDGDPLYGSLRDENRVVMRHNIALNLESFVPASESFEPRPVRTYPALHPVRPPFFSLIIPNYNGLAHLPHLFEALAEQTFDDFEIIVVDDASSDGSVHWLEENASQARLIVNRRNRGFDASVNLAAQAAHGRLLVLLNNDTAPDPAWLRELARTVCHTPDAALFASKLLLFDEPERLHAAGDSLGRDGVARNRGVWERDESQYDEAVDIFGACGAAMAIRREVWDALGGFDESFWMYMEDVDFSFRARLMGWRAVLVPGARVYHKLSSSGGDELSSYYVGRNSIWTIVKNMPTDILWREFPRIVQAQARISLDALRNWRGRAARSRLRGQIDALVHLRQALAKRRLIQDRRSQDDSAIARLLVE